MDSVTANYFALFEVINHSFGEPGIPRDPGKERLEKGMEGIPPSSGMGSWSQGEDP